MKNIIHIQRIIIILLLNFTTVTYSQFPLSGCSHQVQESGLLETKCRIKYSPNTNTKYGSNSDYQVLIATYIFESYLPLERNSNEIHLKLKRCLIRKYQGTPKSRQEMTEFSINRRYWAVLTLINELEIDIEFNYNISGSKVIPQTDYFLIDCIVYENCTIAVNVTKQAIMTDEWESLPPNMFYGSYGPPFLRFIPFIKVLKDKWSLDNLTVTYYKTRAFGILYPNTILDGLRGFDVRRMNFDSSNIAQIDEQFGNNLQSFPNLQSLQLANNKIRKIHSKAFTGNLSIEILDLSGNRLQYIPESVYNLQKLRSLDFTSNLPKDGMFALEDIDGVKPLLSLKNLSLSNAPIKDLKILNFELIPNLISLHLKNCSLKRVPRLAFSNLKHLQYLDMSLNSMESFDDKAFAGLVSLRTLEMSGCSLKEEILQGDHLMHLNLLENLMLENNSISSISMVSGTSATYINMNSNVVGTWHRALLEGRNANRTRLLLKNNKVDVVTTAMLDDIYKLGQIDLTNNPFDCANCEFGNFQKHLKVGYDAFGDGETYTCALPEQDRGVLLVNHNFVKCAVKSYTVMIIAVVLSSVVLLVLVSIGVHYKWYIAYAIMAAKSKVRKVQKVREGGGSYVFDAFVCFSDREREWVHNQVLHQFEPELKMCIHDRDFLPGASITDNIIGSISNSRNIVLVVSTGFIESRWCLYETHLAQHRVLEEDRNSLVLIKMDDLSTVTVPKSLNYLLKTRTHLIWPRDKADLDQTKLFWLRLKNILSSGRQQYLKFNHII